jgi:short-subunit dehydrogenase
MNRNQWLALGGAGIGAAAALHHAWRKSRAVDLSGEVALITGGSRGFGLALARQFAAQGCRIAICARDQEELERARAILEDEGISAFAYPCDVSDPQRVDELIRKVRERLGRVDILVNNAGVIMVAPIENTTIADFERAMEIMFWGVVHPTLAVLPEMIERGRGRIVTITSIGGKVSVPHLNAYSCAKAAAVAFCEGLHAEMSPHGVQVTTIAPGLMRTGSHVNAVFKGDHQNEGKWFSAAATLPGITMSAERAARQTVEAVRQGTAVKVLSTQADLLARANGAFPGLIPALMSLIVPLLPGATGDSITAKEGRKLRLDQGRLFRTLTTLGRQAGARLNQPA